MVLTARFAFALTATAVLWGAPATATPVHYTSIWFFGDSLTDNGNLFAATADRPEGPIPEDPPYYQGRRSNGEVWAEHVAQDFTDMGLPAENYAYVFGNAAPNSDGIPDLDDQIGMLDAQAVSRFGARPLASLFFGANDIFGAIAAVAALNMDEAQAVEHVSTAAATAALAVVGGIGDLAVFGIDDFLVFNLPALNQTPAFAGQAGEGLALLGTTVFNNTLTAGLAGLGQTVTLFDTFGLFQHLLGNPGYYDLTNVKDPCFIPTQGVFHPACVPDEWAFFDPVHPNQVVHRALADEVRKHVAPVPLPLPGALLAVGLVLMAGLRGRARG